MDDQQAAEALKRIKVSTNGNTVQVQIAMSKEELLDNIRKMQEQRARGGVRLAGHHPMLGVTTTASDGDSGTAAVPAVPPAPPKPG